MLLRGVNVGSARRVVMREWAARLRALGLDDVSTHLNSGQAVVTTQLPAARLAALVRDDLAAYGVDTHVLVRDHDQLQQVVDGCPWPQEAAQAPTTVHVAFVEQVPTSGWVVEDPDRYLPEQARVGPGVVYLLMPNGAGRTRLPTSGEGTARNWRTVLTLLELTARS